MTFTAVQSGHAYSVYFLCKGSEPIIKRTSIFLVYLHGYVCMCVRIIKYLDIVEYSRMYFPHD